MNTSSQTFEHDSQESGLKAWLIILNTSIDALEETVWQAREIADQAVETVRSIERGKDAVLEESKELADQAAAWVPKIKRLTKTGWVLSKLTASYRLWGTRSAFIPRSKTEAALEKLHKKNAVRFRKLSLEHGGAFLKVGQLLSARADILPEVWIQELAVLQDAATPEGYMAIRNAIEAEFGDELENIFHDFELEPIAAASIGQVHSAILKDGRKVAVKVQRPGIDEKVKIDMSLMKLFLKSLENVLPLYDLDTITAEIERTILEELDYEQETHYMRSVGEFLNPVDRLIVPAPVDELCGKRILTSEFIEGIKLTEALDKKSEAGDTDGVADLLGRLLDMYLRQVLEAGEFQADPHPGNILITDNDEIVLLDFGCTMTLPEAFKKGYGEILRAAIANDNETVAKVLMDLGFKTRSGKPDTLIAFANALLETITNFAQSSGQGEMKWPNVDDMIREGKELLELSNEDPVEKIPAEFIMLARVFTTLGGLFTHYKPELNVNTYLLPHLLKAA